MMAAMVVVVVIVPISAVNRVNRCTAHINIAGTRLCVYR
jgi:hypothetical protein